MKRIAPALALVLAAMPAPGHAAAERFMVADFDRVSVSGGLVVKIRRMRSTSVIAQGSRAGIESLSVEVIGRQLVVQPRRQAASGFANRQAAPVSVEIGLPSLRAVRISGSARVSVDQIAAANAELALSGSGSLDISRVTVDQLAVVMSGSGGIAIAGSAKTASAKMLGSGKLNGASLTVDHLSVSSAGSGTVEFTARRTANVASTGSGNVVISGTPACTVNTIGAGDVRCGRGR